jgi:4-phosphopantoate--beta-alanine ligase
MSVPKNHPRYLSLMTRDRLVEGVEKGLAVPQGLIAHGRGEAFDYLLGERTTGIAKEAIRASATRLVAARDPVISVNGNVASLCPEGISDLANSLGCPAEVNLFHRSEDRIDRIAKVLEEAGCRKVLGRHPDRRIPGLDHARAHASSYGIFKADVVLVPLEDGDRCEALVNMGKLVITIDLNPLSRTSRKAHISIIDNIVRAIPCLIEEVRALNVSGSIPEIKEFDNARNLERSLDLMTRRFLIDGSDG